MRYLSNRVIRLERYRAEVEADSAVTIRLWFEGQPESDRISFEPGTRTLHVEFDRQAWWGEIGEDGRERWIANA